MPDSEELIFPDLSALPKEPNEPNEPKEPNLRIDVLRPEIIKLLALAAESDHGVWVKSVKPDALRQLIYQIRREEGNPSFDALRISTGPDNDLTLWLIKRKDQPSKEE